MSEQSNPIGFWAEKMGIKLNYRPTPALGKKYCDCDNAQHAGCSIQIESIPSIVYCEWCKEGCVKRKNE